MKWISSRNVAAFALAAAAGLVLGCSDNATQPKVTKPRYPEATAPEIVIGNLFLSYKDRNIEQFEKLLHQDYIWYNRPGDAPLFLARSEDCAITRNLFLAAQHLHPAPAMWLDKLDLELYGGAWTSIVEFNGAACDDCWETTREYFLVLMMTSGGTIYVAGGSVRILVVPAVVTEKTVYRIIRCDEIRTP